MKRGVLAVGVLVAILQFLDPHHVLVVLGLQLANALDFEGRHLVRLNLDFARPHGVGFAA
jgi:hypothetical protein